VGKEMSLDELDYWFGEFWAAYPRRVGKLAAYRRYKEAMKHAEPEVINAGARRYARERAGQDTQYTKHPSTWLNAGCWDDEEGANAKITYVSERHDAVLSGNVVPIGFYAAEDSPELKAWDAYYMKTRGGRAPRDRSFGFRFPTRWPNEQRFNPPADSGDNGPHDGTDAGAAQARDRPESA